MDDVKKLIDDHWDYVEKVLKFDTPPYIMKRIEFHYRAAALHFYKHGREDYETPHTPDKHLKSGLGHTLP